MIQMKNVHKRLGGKPILQGADLFVAPGEIRSVIGRSGEGKSVLIKHVCGLMKADKGTVIVDSENITDYQEKDLFRIRKKVGLIFQYAALFDSLNVLKNVGFSLYEERKLKESEIRDIVMHTLRQVKLGDILDKMPSELSGGMKKRVGLARAIVQKPKILLYDEPTSGLDPVTADAINDLIASLAEELNATSVVITHDMASAFKISSHISMLLNGKVIFTGSPEETRETDNEIVQQFIQGKSVGPLSNM
ncbi:MAG: ABC transporter ATP-binding protein [Candidatus Omnitrophica bacterium]|nr:ABC transporter ATP-binding protein [Candidatus Omnitrophota bacterium]